MISILTMLTYAMFQTYNEGSDEQRQTEKATVIMA